jgi:hypothetical protein
MYLQHWYELVDLLLLHYTDVPRLRRDLIEAQRPDLLQVVDARLAPDPDLDEYPDADGLPED